MKIHKIEVRQREGSEGQIMTGGNTQLFIDGKPLKGVKSFKLEVVAGEIATIAVEMYAEVSVESMVNLALVNEPVTVSTE